MSSSSLGLPTDQPRGRATKRARHKTTEDHLEIKAPRPGELGEGETATC